MAQLTAPKKRPVPWVALGILQLVGVILVWRTSVLPFQASHLSILSNDAYSVHDYDSMLAYAQQAAAIWTPYIDEQSFLLGRNLIDMQGNGQLSGYAHWKDLYTLARDLNQQEFAAHPLDTHNSFVYARFLQEMDTLVPEDAALAEQIYKQAIQSSPKRQQLFQGLAQLYAQEGRLTDLLNIDKELIGFDPEYGESHWNYGLALMYDKGDVQNGVQEIKLSQTVSYPYHIQNVRELIGLADAYIVLKDMDGLKNAVAILQDNFSLIGQTQDAANVYAQLAYKYQVEKLIDQRDQILALGKQIDPTVTQVYAQMLQAKGPNGNPLSIPTAQTTTAATTTKALAPGGPRR